MNIDRIVAQVNDLQDGEMKEVNVGKISVLLVRVAGEFYALGSKCTHFGAPLAEGVVHEHRVRCPWHQACFDVVTGDLEEPPALDALPHFAVRVEGEDVIVSVPEDAKEQRLPTMTRKNLAADSRTFVIIGTGGAGNAAAEALRQDGFHGRIVMVTKENRLPYDRTGLSKSYLKSDDSEPEYLRAAEFYDDYDIEILTRQEVVNVDTAAKSVLFHDGSALKYDKLLLATGSIPRRLNIPGASLEKIFTLRNPDDANMVKTLAKKGSNVVVIGASFIGMETAANLAGRNLAITVVAPEAVPFERTLGEQIGQMYKKLHEENGISFRLSTKVTRFEGNQKVQKVVLENGAALEADLVILGIGVQPATGFLKDLKFNPDGSLSVDKHFCVTEDIYAAGDIASFIDWRTGERIRIEHWRLAEQHGRLAAHNMAGRETGFRSVPFFWTNQLGVNLRYVGHVKDWDEIIFHGDVAARNFAAFYVKNGQVLAVAGAGSTTQMPAVAELMRVNQLPTLNELRRGSVDMVQRLKQL
ncbi:Rieske 2Fe-2S domain-containing protein [Candidatus Poribacteria bacterium]|nr:Rieske 2Fe-2S domain-containing protein [Candidatus Poribacteria bacterium]